MAVHTSLVPFLLKWETGVTIKRGEEFGDYFKRARARGFVNDPVDSGGATCCGITYATYKTYRRRVGGHVPTEQELRLIPMQEWVSVFKTMYWDRWRADEIKSQAVANMLVDYVWTSGYWGIRKPQELLGVTADGVVGPMTIAAVNAYEPQALLFARLKQCRVQWINKICENSLMAFQRKVGHAASEREKYAYTKYKFMSGWMKRINAINYNSLG